MKTEIIYEDHDIIVARKPAGLATQTARIGAADMVSELKSYLAKSTADSPKKESYLGVVHRLDQPVEGLLVFGKNKRAAAALTKELQKQILHKEYYAVTLAKNASEDVLDGVLKDYLVKDSGSNTAKVVTADTPGAKEAVLHFQCLSKGALFALYHIHIETGRFHQIRAQMAHAGMALVGDRKYAGEEEIQAAQREGIRGLALCAYELSFRHPVTGKQMSFDVEPQGDAFSHLE